MSSGYSSKTGDDLPSSIKMRSILNENDIGMSAFYFAIGGPISEGQKLSKSMNEDLIHSRGVTEILRDEISQSLPAHMIPNKIVVLPEIPKHSNGKLDSMSLTSHFQSQDQVRNKAKYHPKTKLQKQLCLIWSSILKYTNVYVDDEFFESGGNSLSGVMLISEINQKYNSMLPLQILFNDCSIRKLEKELLCEIANNTNRTILLNNSANKSSIFCWPGLGGYPMGLKNIAQKMNIYRNFYGLQSY
jgi:hypothetical protein